MPMFSKRKKVDEKHQKTEKQENSFGSNEIGRNFLNSACKKHITEENAEQNMNHTNSVE